MTDQPATPPPGPVLIRLTEEELRLLMTILKQFLLHNQPNHPEEEELLHTIRRSAVSETNLAARLINRIQDGLDAGQIKTYFDLQQFVFFVLESNGMAPQPKPREFQQQVAAQPQQPPPKPRAPGMNRNDQPRERRHRHNKKRKRGPRK